MGRYKAIALAIIAALILSGCGATTTTPTNTPPPPPDTAATTFSHGKTCSYPSEGQPSKPAQPPQSEAVPNSGTFVLVLTLEAGVVNMTMNRAGAPCAVNSMESLARQGYFDGTVCHRLAPGFVLQCGDPTATGTGGPGYKFADELSGTETYRRGTVAMANSGKDTNGSQFFIVLADASLPPQYSVLGTVDPTSMEVVDAIAAAGVDPADPAGIRPIWGAGVESMTVG